MTDKSQTGSPLRIRESTAGDRAAIRELCRAVLLPEDTRDEAGLERVMWSPMHLDPVRLVADRGGELTGFIAGATLPDDPATGYVTIVAVRPDRRRQGVGRALVEALERRLAASSASEIWTGGSQPNYWWPGVDQRYQSARDLFGSSGYTSAEEAVNMTVELSSALLDEPQVEGVTLRQLDQSEFSSFQRWVHESWEEAWDRELELTLSRDPVSCFVAEEGGQYIGFAAYDTNRLDCRIEAGEPADLLLLDWSKINDENLRADIDPVPVFFARANAGHIAELIVAGRTVVKDGAVTNIDYASARKEVLERMRAGLKREPLLAAMPALDEAIRRFYEDPVCC